MRTRHGIRTQPCSSIWCGKCRVKLCVDYRQKCQHEAHLRMWQAGCRRLRFGADFTTRQPYLTMGLPSISDQRTVIRCRDPPRRALKRKKLTRQPLLILCYTNVGHRPIRLSHGALNELGPTAMLCQNASASPASAPCTVRPRMHGMN